LSEEARFVLGSVHVLRLTSPASFAESASAPSRRFCLDSAEADVWLPVDVATAFVGSVGGSWLSFKRFAGCSDSIPSVRVVSPFDVLAIALWPRSGVLNLNLDRRFLV
jgi:hypothetical protein